MSRDVANAVIPYTKEIPVDYRVSNYSLFLTTYGPHEYTDWVHESMSWKESCMIGDWSPLEKLTLQGPDVLDFMKSISGINTKVFKIGQGKHIVCTSNRGKVVGEGILLRLAEDTYRLSGGPNLIGWVQFNLGAAGCWKTVPTLNTDDMFVYQVQGPTAVDIVEELVGESLRDIPYMHFKTLDILGASVQVLRQGMSGNIGFELQGPSEKGVEIYNKILEIGEKHGGVVRVGELTKGVNHVEACFPTPTWDFTPDIFDENDPLAKAFGEVIGPVKYFFAGLASRKPGGSADNGAMDAIFSPVELGWSYALCFDHEFPGCEILKEEKTNPKRKVCTLVWNDEDVKDVNDSLYRDGEVYKQFVMPRDYEIAPDKVMKDGKMVGISMSRAYSVYFRKMLSICVLDVDLLEPGTEVSVIWGAPGTPQKEIRAVVAEAPYFNPDKKRDL